MPDIFVRPCPITQPRLRLLCFPPAGYSAAYFHSWTRPLAAQNIEGCYVQLPGRDERSNEPAHTSTSAAIAEFLETWNTREDDCQFALFGHSMGAILAYETALQLVRQQRRLPAAVVVSGRRAPHTPHTISPISEMDDNRFLAVFQSRYGALPSEILLNADLRTMFLGRLRADVSLVERYRPGLPLPLPIPLGVYAGANDPFTPEEELQQWQQYSRFRIRLRRFDGGHDFPSSCRAHVLACLLKDLP